MIVPCFFDDSLFFVTASLDRAAHLRRDPRPLFQLRSSESAAVVAFWEELCLLHDDGRAFFAMNSEAARLLALSDEAIFLGLRDGQAIFAVDAHALPAESNGMPPCWAETLRWQDLRSAAARVPIAESAILAAGLALVNWSRQTRFCNRCGSPVESREGGHLRACLNAACSALHYPRLDNAVIVRVSDGERLLLHRQPHWPAGMWSVLAGFVEPGETLESAVIRETMEETGIIITDVCYAGSQPWPFPSSLMVGFTARAVGGSLRPDPHELEDARWFSRADMAILFSDDNRNDGSGGFFLARPGTIARKLIDDWLRLRNETPSSESQ